MLDANSTDRARQPTMWARIAARFVAWAVERGVDRDALLARARVAEGALADLDARVPLIAVYDLLEAASEALDDPLVGLRFIRWLTIEDLDALGLLILTSPSLRQILERTSRYLRVFNDGERFELEVRDDSAHVFYLPYGPDRPAHAIMAQMTIGDFVVNGGARVGGLTGAVVRLRASGRAGDYRALLGVDVELGTPVDEVVVSLEVLERPLPDANPILHRYFERWAERMVERLPAPASVAERLEQLLLQLLPSGDANVDEIARRLRSSPRTLQRRLAEEGTSFKATVEGVRRRHALVMLDGGAAIAEVAWMLGYSEPSAFHRAFRRWTGKTPEAWRGRAR